MHSPEQPENIDSFYTPSLATGHSKYVTKAPAPNKTPT